MHSTILVGTIAEARALVPNGTVREWEFGDMLVGDVRAIVAAAYLKSDGQHFIIKFDKANDSAQNALLKVVEEAPGSTVFIFCVPHLGAVLPTLQSRCVITRGSQAARAGIGAEFLHMSYKDRLAFIDKLLKDAKDEEDKSSLRAFTSDIVCAAPASRAALDADLLLKSSAVSPKLVLTHLAVTLPQF